MYSYKDAKFEFKLTSDGDKWGNGMIWLFNIADEIHFNRDTCVPDEWQFRPSPLGPSSDDDYQAEIVQNMPDDDLLRFGNVIHRYLDRVRFLGEDY